MLKLTYWREGLEMDVWVRNIGWVTVLTALLVLIKRQYDRIYLLQECTYENSGVYAAAARFAGGASAREVSELLVTSFEFDRQETEVILAWALPHRMEADGGYGAFIGAVNRVLGKEIYHPS
ncbi:hypothetical protein NST04_20825 [Paenibacillus sp. FSL H7-0756]|uniref:hypothetical protein n=1 Tax=unclassified Paenibacillus TaxID=185978 RepID=UPI0030F87A85